MTELSSDSSQPLDRYIDRFLYAEGWRVTNVVSHSGPARFEVTITKTMAPFEGHAVTRSASNAGEATFKACSGAR
jgi:hypothetical protein